MQSARPTNTDGRPTQRVWRDEILPGVIGNICAQGSLGPLLNLLEAARMRLPEVAALICIGQDDQTCESGEAERSGFGGLRRCWSIAEESQARTRLLEQDQRFARIG